MAKTPKVKKREISIHSRAAKRGASPPPKDLAVKPPVEETEYKPWLYNAQNAGISKRKKSKQLTRQQRQRQQRSLDHAERNIDKLEKKVADSKTRGKKVNARRAQWDELNERIEGKENLGETKDREAVKGAAKDGTKAMEGMEQPDLEQPLPIRTADEIAAEVSTLEIEEAKKLEESNKVLPADDLDEIT